MYRKALALTLLGVLVMGAATVAYGTLAGPGFVSSLAGVVGGGDGDDHDGDHDREHDREHEREGRRHDDD